MPKEPLFRLGRYWIDRVAGTANWYRFWYDAGVGEIRRRSLGTADFEQAKIGLAAVVIRQGSGRPAEPKDAPLIAVLSRYWEEHSDRLRNRDQPRLAGRLVLDFLGNDARVGAFTRKRQLEFMQGLYARRLSAQYIARLMTTVQAALNYAVAVDDDDEAALLTRAPKLIYQVKAVAAALGAPDPEPVRWTPDVEMIARFLDALTPEEEFLRRWTILIIGFGCRGEAALEAGPYQLDRATRMIRLNPQGRRQTKKHRPTIPVADCLWPLLEEWSTTPRFSGVLYKVYPSKQWRLARERAGLPSEFTPRSLRHLVATELRHAHKRYGVPRVPLDEREMFMGHRRARINDLYGGYEADYLSAATTAIDATLRALNAACKRPFLRQVSAKAGSKTKAATTLKLLR